MSSIPPNGAFTATLRAFDGGGQTIADKTIHVSCRSVHDARDLFSQGVAEIEEIKRNYEEGTEGTDSGSGSDPDSAAG